jgi:uncharacterized damage-inducible protein DinB
MTSPMIAARALADCVDELAALVDRTTDADYVATPAGGVSGSIGAHVRHCLDHVHAVLEAVPGGVVSYDHRARQVALEQCRELAAEALRAAVARLDGLGRQAADAPVTLVSQVDRAGRRVQVASSLGRELVFALQHTIHHQATVAVLLAERGVPVSRTFGYAPSTPRPAA